MRRGGWRLGGALLFAAHYFWLAGVTVFSIVSLFILLAFWQASLWVDANTGRPRRTFYYFGLASAALFFPLVVDVGLWGGSVLLGALTWAGICLLAAIWTIHYERTEPLG